MDRFSGTNFATIGGIRQFIDLNLATNTPGSYPNALWFNGVQESIVLTVIAAGLTPTDSDNTQLKQAIVTLPPGRLLNIQYFKAAGTFTYTATAGTNAVDVEVIGGGGAGGGSAATSSSQCSAGSGGGAGGYTRKRITGSSNFSGQTVTVGAAGSGSAGSAGGNGGTSSFGSVLTATGGYGGSLGPAASSSTASFVGQGNGGSGSGGDINAMGGIGSPAFYSVTPVSGKGGASALGEGAIYASGTSSGSAASSAGSGGSGGCQAASSSGTAAGGNGAAGCVIIREYS